MELSFWLESLFSRSRRRSLPRHRQRHRNQPLPACIEILEQRVMLAADFGDAPLPYPTTQAEGGAEHDITVGAPKLGATVDSEADGVHSAAADADGADDDGVTFPVMAPCLRRVGRRLCCEASRHLRVWNLGWTTKASLSRA